jgi:serine/threonine-protein kinase
MGEVYRAFDTRLNRNVAIKVLVRTDTRGTPTSSGSSGRLAASALNHPNIVTIHDVGQTEDGGYYIVQELVEGKTLRALGASARSATVAEMVRRVPTLVAAHGAGIVHRDIKPENIMVRGDGCVKL